MLPQRRLVPLDESPTNNDYPLAVSHIATSRDTH